MEDFITLDHDRVLISIDYNRFISVFDLNTGEILSNIFLGPDYIKGIIKDDEFNLTTYGGNGIIKSYCLQENHAIQTGQHYVC